jgi:hypothetical protein
LPSPLWGRGWRASGVIASRGGPGEGVSPIVNSYVGHHTRSAAFACPSGTSRGPKKQVRATPSEFQGLARRVSAEEPQAVLSVAKEESRIALRILRAISFASFTLSGRARFFAALRMTANGLRMTVLERSSVVCKAARFRTRGGKSGLMYGCINRFHKREVPWPPNGGSDTPRAGGPDPTLVYRQAM